MTFECDNIFLQAYHRIGFSPIAPHHVATEQSRLVHDLGIAGDDIDEILEEMELDGRTEKLLRTARFIPNELSRDAYFVSMARNGLSKRFPTLARYYISKLRVPPLTVTSFLEIIQ